MPENTTPSGDASAEEVPFFGTDSTEQSAPGDQAQDGAAASSSKGSKRGVGGRTGATIMRALGLPSGESKQVEAEPKAPKAKAKHKASEASATPAEGGAATRGSRRDRPKKPNERLSSVLAESVVGTAITRIAACKEFEVTPGVFAMLRLDVDDIGGLSKKSGNDVDKGGIIQAMINDRISYVSTAEMLENEWLLILPTMDTIKMMEEFRLLCNAPYTWCLVNTTNASELKYENAGPATYTQAQDVLLEDITIGEAVVSGASSTVEVAQVEEQRAPLPAPRHAAPAPAAEQSAPAPEQAPASQAAPVAADPVRSASVPTSFEDDDLLVGGDEESENFDDEPYQDPQDDDPEGRYDNDEVTSEELDEAIKRRFHDTRLDVEVTTAEFEDYVTRLDEVTPFLPTETRGSSWLNDVVAAYTDAANGEIAAMHERHVEEARQIYIDLVSNGIVKIERLTSLENPETMYGKLKLMLDAEIDTERARVEKLTSEELVRLHEEFDRGRETAANAAAESARARYDEDNQARLDRESKEVPERMANFIGEMRQNRLDDVIRDRRAGAAAHIDALITQSLQAMREKFDAQRDAEAELAKSWSERIIKVVDEHLKDDIARHQTIQEEMERTNKIEELKTAHQNELARRSEQYTRETDELTRNLTEQRAQSEASLAGLRESLQSRIDEAEGNARAGRERVEALESQLATLQERADEQRRNEVNAVERERAADIESFNKRWAGAMVARRVILIVAIALIILVAVAGFMVGLKSGQSSFIDLVQVSNNIHEFLN